MNNENNRSQSILLEFKTIQDPENKQKEFLEFELNEQYNPQDDIEDAFKRPLNLFGRLILYPRKAISDLTKKPIINKIILVALAIIFVAYFTAAMSIKSPFNFPTNEVNSTEILVNYVFSNNSSLALLIITVIMFLLIIWDNLIIKLTNKIHLKKRAYHKYIPWIVTIIVLILCIIYLCIDLESYYNLTALLGIALLVSLACMLSVFPSDIQWRTITVGLLLQFIFGVFILRLEFGYQLFQFLGDKMLLFLKYTDYGTTLVFGEAANDHFLGMRGLPIAIFFGGIVNLLYYLGAIQYVILKFSWVVNKLMDTSPTESMNAVASIFLGQTEAPLLIKPFLKSMTPSELFSIMLSGFATVAGSSMAAYVGLGVKPNHILTASIMSSPAALAIAKTIFPETNTSKAQWDDIKNLPKGKEKNVFEAFAVGASNMVKPIGCIIANLIAFRAIFQFIDAGFEWIFGNLGLKNFGLVSLLQYPFSILSFSMGVPSEDIFTVAKLMAKKMFIHEIVAYEELGYAIKFRESAILNGTFDCYRNGTCPYEGTVLWNEKSTVIATYALCGFSSFCSLGICIGALTALAPSRAKIFARYSFRAQLGGNITCFLTACFAGLLYKAQV